MRKNNIIAGLLRAAVTAMVFLFFVILLYSCSSSSRTNSGDTTAPALDSVSTVPGKDTSIPAPTDTTTRL
ncbi:hypothetical protein MKQ70_08585 [Chitinophaga sedimenti]|uniref:hypothetical protein n=1 Tax=Chitinophaga sedimenti TaxID=2033606 RepID=UPI002006D369|nr:hypothetical protein [Chitinophaga sedimenti]MCK7555062.1 hypothetical protein [Chitinophaga sedimenti]